MAARIVAFTVDVNTDRRPGSAYEITLGDVVARVLRERGNPRVRAVIPEHMEPFTEDAVVRLSVTRVSVLVDEE